MTIRTSTLKFSRCTWGPPVCTSSSQNWMVEKAPPLQELELVTTKMIRQDNKNGARARRYKMHWGFFAGLPPKKIQDLALKKQQTFCSRVSFGPNENCGNKNDIYIFKYTVIYHSFTLDLASSCCYILGPARVVECRVTL